ncbi:MAG: ABC transporter permease [Gemmatimonadota bacterium]
MNARELFGRCRAWWHREQLDRELAEELEEHIEFLARDLEHAGTSPDEALAVARRQVGNIGRHREASRDVWGFPTVDDVLQDLRQGMRGLRRSPLFTLTMVGTIALGVGAATAMFSVVNGVLLRPLPYRDPAQLVTIYSVFPGFRGQPTTGELWNVLRTPYPDYVRYRDAAHSVTSVAGFNTGTVSATFAEETVELRRAQGTANLLQTLGVSVAQGRWFLPGEEGRGSPRLAVLSHRLWMGRFGGSAIIGTTITLNEAPFVVIGILPPSFGIRGRIIGTEMDVEPDVWIPIGADGRGFEPGNHTLEIVGRLQPGVTIDAAFAEAEPLIRGDASPAKRTARMIPRVEAEIGAVRQPLLLLLGAVAVFLAIACGNVAALFLAECTRRKAELRTRIALGAGRARMIRLLLTESGMLALAGALIGAGFAWFATRTLLAVAPSELPHADQVAVDFRVLAFTAAIASLVAAVSAVAPALHFTRNGERLTSVGNRVVAGRSRVQSVAIGIQAAGTLVLLISAGLLGRSFLREGEVDPGFVPGNALLVGVTLPRSQTASRADTKRLYDLLTEALGDVPAVSTVTAMSTPPLSGRSNGQAVRTLPIEDPTLPATNVSNAAVLANYFETMGIPVLAGRPFSSTDTAGAPLVAIVSEAMARRFWGVTTAVGRQFKHPNGIATVVGVVGDVRSKALHLPAEPQFYLPASQAPGALTFILRTRGDPMLLGDPARRAVWRTVGGATISQVTSTAALMERALAPSRYRAVLAALFGALAIALTLVGVAGLAARTVSIRMRELCLRMALGATRSRAVVLAIGPAMLAVVIGAGIGLLVASTTSRLLSNYLYEVTPTDALTYAAVTGGCVAACFIAGVIAAKPLYRTSVAAILREE